MVFPPSPGNDETSYGAESCLIFTVDMCLFVVNLPGKHSKQFMLKGRSIVTTIADMHVFKTKKKKITSTR